MNKIFLIVILGLLYGKELYSQEKVSPLDIPLFLSGNFGELRSNHFHSGIDFKTQGIIGLPVNAVDDGYISRISVSPYGYGKALYIDHPDGTTSVYAHLDKFAPKFETIVRDSQYQKESFAVNLYFESNELVVKRGERIAYSGNTGGSGGPHVHFEFRDTKSEEPFDPLLYFKDKIKDSRPPEIQGLRIYPQFNKGIVNGKIEDQSIPIVKDRSGKQTINASITAWGEIGVGIKAYDRMDGTSNIYGVNEIILKVDGEEIYHSIMDRFSFDNTRYLNTYIDWNEWINNRSFYMKSFTDPGNRLGLNLSLSRGTIIIDKEKDYLFEYALKDVYGNTSVLDFNIAGVESVIPVYNSEDILFSFNKDNEYNGLGISINIPRGNLYSNVFLKIDTIQNNTNYGPIYEIGERIPLHQYCSLVLDVQNDSYPEKTKYGIVYNWRNKRTWIGGDYENGKMKTEIRELGQFSIETDTIPPLVKPFNEGKWTKSRRISFKITDDLSGISFYKGTLNDDFILFEYDAKTNSLFYVFDSKRMDLGEKFLKLVVRDKVGNESYFSGKIVFQ